MSLKYDPEYLKLLTPFLPLLSTLPKPPIHDIPAHREHFSKLLHPLHASLPFPPFITKRVHRIPSYDGVEIEIIELAPQPMQTLGGNPAILHAHSGGMICGSASTFEKTSARIALETMILTFSVNYRLAPENPHPTPVEDVFAGLKWLQAHAARRFGVNPGRICLFGESSGAGIAAGVALLARDRRMEPPLAKQVLVYPMLDNRTVVGNGEEDKELSPFLSWSYADNTTAWSALLGGTASQNYDETKIQGLQYASPARAETLKGLPDTYIDVGGLDLFRDECIAYAQRLVRDGVNVEFHLYPGVPHGFEALGDEVGVVKRARANRVAAFKKV
ncbi:MAG: hypothetical protein M1834_000733 [Cirrosporium novae-zelandiae]|nr:MAG: hypothetical protein M1834_000733 [Cirrosporium novae-zelandiae]